METLPTFAIKVLQVLAGRYGMACTLEELTSFLTPVINSTAAFIKEIYTEKEKQARVLNALLILSDEGLIFLDSFTDKSTVTIKGLIIVDNKVFCN